MIEVTIEDLYADATQMVGHLTIVNARLASEVERLKALLSEQVVD